MATQAKLSLWYVVCSETEKKRGLLATDVYNAAYLFVRDIRPDLNGSDMAQNGSVIYGTDGNYYSVRPFDIHTDIVA